MMLIRQFPEFIAQVIGWGRSVGRTYQTFEYVVVDSQSEARRDVMQITAKIIECELLYRHQPCPNRTQYPRARVSTREARMQVPYHKFSTGSRPGVADFADANQRLSFHNGRPPAGRATERQIRNPMNG